MICVHGTFNILKIVLSINSSMRVEKNESIKIEQLVNVYSRK